MPKGYLENIAPLLVVRIVRIVQYNPATEKTEQHTHRKTALGFVPSFFLGNVPTKLLTFLEALSENLSQSPSLVVSCTLPNAFFYKSEKDIFPPKCLFTFPNPKSKGQD
jgi:hypothetical protein